MATPLFEQGRTLEDVLELSADELREELAGREIDAKGMSKVEIQKAFIKILFPVVPVAPVVTQLLLLLLLLLPPPPPPLLFPQTLFISVFYMDFTWICITNVIMRSRNSNAFL